MEVLKEEKPKNEIEYIDSFDIISSHKWVTKPSSSDKFTILKKERTENIGQFTNERRILKDVCFCCYVAFIHTT